MNPHALPFLKSRNTPGIVPDMMNLILSQVVTHGEGGGDESVSEGRREKEERVVRELREGVRMRVA